MAEHRIILALGRMERVLSKLETFNLGNRDDDSELRGKYDHLVAETRHAVAEMDELLKRNHAHG
jgi:hypothetical protein